MIVSLHRELRFCKFLKHGKEFFTFYSSFQYGMYPVKELASFAFT
jgi:hypothetical protein